MASSGGLSVLEESSESGVRFVPPASHSSLHVVHHASGVDAVDASRSADETVVCPRHQEIADSQSLKKIVLDIKHKSHLIREEALRLLGDDRVFHLMFENGMMPTTGNRLDLLEHPFFSFDQQAELYESNRDRILFDQGLIGLTPDQFMPFLMDPRCGLDPYGKPRIRFRLFEMLGSGSFARVYRAYDGLKDREVTLKVIVFKDPESSENEPLQMQMFRMIFEAFSLKTIQHPNAARLYDDFACITIDGGVFAMDGNYGVSLSKRLKQGVVFSEQDILSICGSISGALDAMHARGVVHRDVKPSNVVQDVDGDGKVTLVDFGNISGGRDEATIPALTPIHSLSMNYESATHFFSGTPHYMSPESLFGDPAFMNAPARDMYALGVMAYQLIEGRLPFSTRSMTELVTTVSKSHPPPFQRQDISPVVQAYVMQLLSKKPGARPTAYEAQQFFTRRRIAHVVHEKVPQGCFPETIARFLHSILPQRWIDALV